MSVKIIQGDCREVLKTLADGSVNCCVTSPPYFGLRDYGHAGQIGLEQTPDAYVAEMVGLFGELRRVLRDDGTLWLNIGDSFKAAGRTGHGTREGCKQGTNRASANGSDACRPSVETLKPKDLIGIPWRVAFALQADGWYLRSDIIWNKPNCMPESVTDRPTRSHEYIFLLSKSERYYYDHGAIKEPASMASMQRWAQDVESQAGSLRANGGEKTNGPMKAVGGPRSDKQRGHSRRHDGFNDRWDAMEKSEQFGGLRNKRDVWTVATAQYREAHFATFPTALITPCILAGCPAGGVVLDPFSGSGTSGEVAESLGRNSILIELNPEYVKLAHARTNVTGGLAL